MMEDQLPTFAPDSCLYSGHVIHVRAGALKHRLAYQVTSILLPLHRLEEAGKATRLFSVNRFNLISFHEADHADKDHPNLMEYVQHHLQTAGTFEASEPLPSRISILAFPRFLGHSFNPIAIFFCCNEQDQLQAILYQVNNTFGQRHHYAYRIDEAEEANAANGRLRHGGAKNFYVSPFLDMKGNYKFSIRPPAETASYQITMSGDQPSSITASFVAKRLPLCDANLVRTVGKLWQSGWKILGAIHLEALKLWLKGAPFHRRPPIPTHAVTKLNRPTIGKGTPHEPA